MKSGNAAYWASSDYLYKSALMVMLPPRSCHWRVMCGSTFVPFLCRAFSPFDGEISVGVAVVAGELMLSNGTICRSHFVHFFDLSAVRQSDV